MISENQIDELIDAAIREKALLAHLDELENQLEAKRKKKAVVVKAVIWSLAAAAGLVAGVFLFQWQRDRSQLREAYAQAISEMSIEQRNSVMRSDSLDILLAEAQSALAAGDTKATRQLLDRLQVSLEQERNAVSESNIESVLVSQMDRIQYEADWLYVLSYLCDGSVRHSREALERVEETQESPYHEKAVDLLNQYFR